jgi:small GTP-binding protein
MTFYDTAGMEKYQGITKLYYQGINAILLVYDITKRDSFASISSYWTREIQQRAGNDVQVFLLGNKADQDGARQVPYEHG